MYGSNFVNSSIVFVFRQHRRATTNGYQQTKKAAKDNNKDTKAANYYYRGAAEAKSWQGRVRPLSPGPQDPNGEKAAVKNGRILIAN
jgi:hypothetical protein